MESIFGVFPMLLLLLLLGVCVGWHDADREERSANKKSTV